MLLILRELSFTLENVPLLPEPQHAPSSSFSWRRAPIEHRKHSSGKRWKEARSCSSDGSTGLHRARVLFVREPTPIWPQHVREDVEEVDPENVRRMRKVLLLGDCLKTQITPLMIVAQRLGSPTRRWATLEGEARKTLKSSWRQLTPPGCVSFYVCKYRKGKLPARAQGKRGYLILDSQ